MFLVEMDVRLGSSEVRLTDDEITDLVEAVVDELDQFLVAPSIGTRRVGQDIEMTVGVEVEGDDQFEVLRKGAAIIGAGLHRAIGSGANGHVVPRPEELRSTVRALLRKRHTPDV